MSENNNSGTQRTLQELSGRTTTGATTATVSEERPLQIGERRDRAVVGEERKFATIDEVNQAFLTPDQKQDAINKLGSDDRKISDMGKKDADKKRRGDDEGKIFEEGDIIDWMFRNIIVKGMDWTGNKAVNIVSFGAGFVLGKSVDFIGAAGSGIYGGLKKRLDKWDPSNGGFGKYPDDNTTKFRKTIADFHAKDMKECESYLSEENFNALMNAMRMASEGRTDELNTMFNGKLSPQTLEMINGMTPELRQQTFALTPEQEIGVAAYTIDTAVKVKHFAANMAYVRLMNDKMNDKDQPKGNVGELYMQYQEDARQDMYAYMKELEQSGYSIDDQNKKIDELLGLSLEAGQHVDKQIEKRNYNEHDDKPNRNTALEKIEDLTAVTKTSPYRQVTYLDSFTTEVIATSAEHQRELEGPNNEQNANDARRDILEERRQKLNATVERIRNQRANDNGNHNTNANGRTGGRSL